MHIVMERQHHITPTYTRMYVCMCENDENKWVKCGEWTHLDVFLEELMAFFWTDFDLEFVSYSVDELCFTDEPSLTDIKLSEKDRNIARMFIEENRECLFKEEGRRHYSVEKTA
jgi:hypothetical protein